MPINKISANAIIIFDYFLRSKEGNRIDRFIGEIVHHNHSKCTTICIMSDGTRKQIRWDRMANISFV